VFQSKMSPDEIIKFYEAELPRRGWHRMIGAGLSSQIWQKEGVTLVWSCAGGLPSRDMGDHATTINFVEQGPYQASVRSR
jgi:hypothetical protein